jgi:hypothetical protein
MTIVSPPPPTPPPHQIHGALAHEEARLVARVRLGARQQQSAPRFHAAVLGGPVQRRPPVLGGGVHVGAPAEQGVQSGHMPAHGSALQRHH